MRIPFAVATSRLLFRASKTPHTADRIDHMRQSVLIQQDENSFSIRNYFFFGAEGVSSPADLAVMVSLQIWPFFTWN